MNFTHAKLPQNFSGAYLSYVDLTGQRFTCTDFTNTQFDGVLLTNTTCDYQQCFQDNVKANQLSGGLWYLDNLPKDLKSIAQVYPTILQDHHKAELLQIASGLAYLPYHEGKEFYIKVQYWSIRLLLLKKQLGTLGSQLVCSLGDYGLNYEAKRFCWQTDYPQNQVEEEQEAPHAYFDKYLQTFQDELLKYNVKSKDKRGYDWYKKNIEKNIQGLKKAYPKLTSQALRKEAIDIAFQLSKKCRFQHLLFLFHYLSCQNRLIQLKMLAGVGVENDIHYNVKLLFSPLGGWSRGRK